MGAKMTEPGRSLSSTERQAIQNESTRLNALIGAAALIVETVSDGSRTMEALEDLMDAIKAKGREINDALDLKAPH
jgi:hypothetical protein